MNIEFCIVCKVGVQFDEPVGKNDGTAKGVVVFECPPRYGGFLRGKNVKVGNYPERGLEDDDEELESSKKEDEDEF